MSFQTSEEFESPRETMAKLVNFWAKPSSVKRFDTICSIVHIDRSEVLRALVNLFLNDYDFQERVLKGILNNGEVVSILVKSLRGEENG